MRTKSAVVGIAIWLWLVPGAQVAAPQGLPAEGRYQCSGRSGAAELNFAVGPGNIYTTANGRRGTLAIHPGTGNVLFRGAPPHDAYEARYIAGPSPQLALLNETSGGATSDAGIVCRMLLRRRPRADQRRIGKGIRGKRNFSSTGARLVLSKASNEKPGSQCIFGTLCWPSGSATAARK